MTALRDKPEVDALHALEWEAYAQLRNAAQPGFDGPGAITVGAFTDWCELQGISDGDHRLYLWDVVRRVDDFARSLKKPEPVKVTNPKAK